MFDIEKFYKAAVDGRNIEIEELVAYLNSFNNLILWGAGNTGGQICRKLLDLGVEITCFWDKRSRELSHVSGVSVLENYTGGYDPDDTLVIICITNGSLGDGWQSPELLSRGYSNIVEGVRLYEALICPFKAGDKLIHEVCLNNSICSMCNCRKYLGMIPRNFHNDGYEVVIQVATMIITRNCTLNCIYCGQQRNKYTNEQRLSYAPIDDLKSDFDNFISAADLVGMVSIVGGEAFLHPDLAELAQHCLRYESFGCLNITTNGVCKMTKEMLQQMKDPRLKISFSDYTANLTEKQKEVFHKNISLVKEAGINLGIGVPLWTMPGTYECNNYATDYMCERKRVCNSTRLASAIVDGYFVPCTTAEVTRGLDILNYPDDYVSLRNNENVRKDLYRCLNNPYYETCRYCPNEGGVSIPAGEQRDKVKPLLIQ